MSSFERLKNNQNYKEYLQWFGDCEESLKNYCEFFDEKIVKKLKMLKSSIAVGDVVKEIFKNKMDENEALECIDVFLKKEDEKLPTIISAFSNMLNDIVDDNAKKGKTLVFKERDKEKCLNIFLNLKIIPNKDQLYLIFRNNELALQSNYLWERELLCKELEAKRIVLDIYTKTEIKKVDFDDLKCNKILNIKSMPEHAIPPTKIKSPDGGDLLDSKSSNIECFFIYPIFKNDEIDFKKHLKIYTLNEILGRIQKVQGIAWNTQHNILEMIKKHVIRAYAKECSSSSSLVRKIDILTS